MRTPTTENILTLAQDYIADVQDRPMVSDTIQSIEFDSLDQVELIMAIEDEFGQEIPDGFFTEQDRDKPLQELAKRVAKLFGAE